jgi:hypothetical protein
MKRTISSILMIAIAAAVPLHARGGKADSIHDWANVEALKPGTELVVGTAAPADVHRVFVAADDSSLIAMALDALSVARSDKRIIREMTIRYSAALLVPQHPEFVNGHVTIRGDDILVNGRRIAGLRDVIESLPRADVRNVRLDVPHHAHPVDRDAVIGAAIGAGAGFLFGAMNGCRRGASRCDSPGVPQAFALLGGLIGIAAGAAVGASRASRNELVYAAP